MQNFFHSYIHFFGMFHADTIHVHCFIDGETEWRKQIEWWNEWQCLGSKPIHWLILLIFIKDLLCVASRLFFTYLHTNIGRWQYAQLKYSSFTKEVENSRNWKASRSHNYRKPSRFFYDFMLYTEIVWGGKCKPFGKM